MAEINPIYNLINTILDDKEIVIFLGDHVSIEGWQGNKRYPSFDKIVDAILTKFGFNPENDSMRIKALMSIIQKWEYEKKINIRLKEFLDGEPGLSHYYLAAISIALIGRSNALLYLNGGYDSMMEKAFAHYDYHSGKDLNSKTISFHTNITGLDFQAAAIEINERLRMGSPTLIKIFEGLKSRYDILRQNSADFQPYVEKKLIEWLQKPTIFIGYDFLNNQINRLLISTLGISPTFILTPSSLPPTIEKMDKIIHIKNQLPNFIQQFLQIIRKSYPDINNEITNLLNSLNVEKVSAANHLMINDMRITANQKVNKNQDYRKTFYIEDAEEVEKVTKALKSESKLVWELDHDVFEKLVFYCIARYFSNDLEDASYERLSQGAIDMIVKIPNGSPFNNFLETSNIYFVEYKYYRRRNLSFPSVTKAFCAAIRNQPKMLIILSLKDISPQAKDYAQYFFGNDNRYGGGFLRLSMHELVLLTDSRRSTNVDINALSNIKVESWSIIRMGTFSQEEISNSQTASKDINVDNRLNYSVRVWLSGSGAEKIRKICILCKKSKRLNVFHLKEICALNSGGITAAFNLKLSRISKAKSISPAYLQIFSQDSSKTVNISLPNFNLPAKDINIFGNFREAEASRFINKIKKENSPNLIFIHGEGGIGKTYFCEHICSELTFKFNYRAHLINISENTSEGIFYNLIWPVISPGLEYVEKNLTKTNKEILKAIIEKELEDYDSGDINQLANNIINRDIKKVDLEALTFLCAKLFIRSSITQIIVVSNCHKLSPGIINGFRHLFLSLDDLGWGKTKFMLEYRDSKEDFNEEWDRFVSEAKNLSSFGVYKKELKHLTKAQLINGFTSTFVGTDASFLSNSILKKTGGNPLFIRHIALYLQKKGYIQEVIRKSFTLLNIVDYVGVSNELEEIPDVLEEFLQKRIESILHCFSESAFSLEELISYLAIASIVGFEFENNRIAKMYEWNHNQIELIKLFLQSEGIIQVNLMNEKIRFIHEIMWLSVLNVLKRKNTFRQCVLNILPKLNKNFLEDAILGGKALYYINDLKFSFTWYNSAYELAFHSNSYAHQRVCLFGLKKILLKEETLDETMARRKLSIFFRLGEVETQVGSQIDALRVFEQLLDEISIIKDDYLLNYSELLNNIIAIKRNQMTIHHRFLDPISGSVTLKSILQYIHRVDDLQKISSRFLIICFNSNMSSAGDKLIEIFHSIPNTEDNSQRLSSHFSDIGNLYLHSNPKLACRIWNEGNILAITEKQKTHSKLNCLVGSLYYNKKFVDESKLNQLEERIKIQGVENQLIRLTLYKGVKFFYEKKYHESRYCFEAALKRARLKNLKFLEWQAHNNIAICELMEEHYESAVRHIEKSLIIIKNTIDFHFNFRDETDSITKSLLEKHEQLKQQYSTNFHPIFKHLSDYPSSNASGTFNIMLFNLHQLKSMKGFEQFTKRFKEILNVKIPHSDYLSQLNFKNFFLLNLRPHPLRITFQEKPFYLSIE